LAAAAHLEGHFGLNLNSRFVWRSLDDCTQRLFTTE